MGYQYDAPTSEDSSCDSRKIIMHPLYLPKEMLWLDLKVLYVRVSNCEFDESTPCHLTSKHIALTPDTILEVNGKRTGIYSGCVSSILRRDRVDKKSEEATFVSTDSIRMTGSVRFEVCDEDHMLFSGVLVLGYGNGLNGEAKNGTKKWSMRCQPAMSIDYGFLSGKHNSSDMLLPVIEVYVAGCFAGTPIVLTKTFQLGCRNKNHKKVVLASVSKYDQATDLKKEFLPKDDLQVPEYEDYRSENEVEINYNSEYPRSGYLEEEDGELSWFNAGVRVGVGISLGICLGIGLGVGLLVRNFKRRLI